MFIVHICRNPPTGVWSAIKALAAAQTAQGDDVRLGLILSSRWQYSSELGRLTVPFVTVPSPDLFGTAAYAVHAVRKSPVHDLLDAIGAHPQALILHYHNAWLSGAIVLNHASGPERIRQVVTFHGVGEKHALFDQPIRRMVHRRIAHRLLTTGCKLISVDYPNTLVAENLLNLPAKAFSVVPNGIHVPNSLRRRLPNPEITIGHVGVLSYAKGWILVAEAVRDLRREGLPVKLVIAGCGPDEASAREWCAQHPAIGTYLGYVTDAATSLMPKIDILCLASTMEGSPMAILEAIVAGTVVAATAVGGIPDVIQDDLTGCRIQRNRESIVSCLRRLCCTPGLIDRMRTTAFDFVKDNLRIEETAKSYAAVYTGSFT